MKIAPGSLGSWQDPKTPEQEIRTTDEAWEEIQRQALENMRRDQEERDKLRRLQELDIGTYKGQIGLGAWG